MKKTIILNVNFSRTFPQKPKIRVNDPPGTQVKKITTSGCVFTVPVNIHKTRKLRILFAVNGEMAGADFTLQLCPACGTVLDTYIVTTYLAITKSGKPAPGTPIAICPICGNTFVPWAILEQMKEQKDKKIIIPGNIKLN